MRSIPYILYLFLIAFYRTNLIDLFSVGPVTIYLSALIILLVAINKEYVTALWFGFVAGLVYDAPDPSHLGVHALLLSALSVTASQAKERLNLDSLTSRMVLILAGLFIYSVPQTLIYATSGMSEFFTLMIRVALPSILYTAVIGWLFFMVQSGRLSYTKLKSIF